MKRNFFVLVLFSLSVFIPVSLFSAVPVQPKNTPLPAIYFVRGRTLKQGHLAIRTYYVKPILTKVYSSLKNAMVPIPSTTKANFNSGVLFASYGITDYLTIGMNAQLIFNTLSTPLLTKTGFGIGDMETLIKYGLIQNKLLTLSAALNIAYPTGNTDTSLTNIPLGSGTFDFSFRLLSDWRLGKTLLTGAAFYTLNGTNPNTGLNYGDSVRFILTEAVPFTRRFSMEFGINYEHHFENANPNGIIANTYKDFFSVFAGTQYMITKHLFAQGLYEYSPYAFDTFQRGHTFKVGASIIL